MNFHKKFVKERYGAALKDLKAKVKFAESFLKENPKASAKEVADAYEESLKQ